VAALIQDQHVMLADQHKRIAAGVADAITALTAQNYIFDEKLDGVRAMVHITDGKVKIINRRSLAIDFRYPDVVAALETAFPGPGHKVLDGEIVCRNAAGLIDFHAVHRRDAQTKLSAVPPLAKAFPATFVAFDLLWYDGDDHRQTPYTARRTLLEVEHRQRGGFEITRNSTDGTALWTTLMSEGGEGLVAKTPFGPYKAGRSLAWIKIKQCHTISCVIVGYTLGNGRRANVPGAFQLALVGPNGPVPFGRVGTGFKDHELAALGKRVDAGELLIADVEIQNITQDGEPRFPSFKGIRTDITLMDCSIAQLETVTQLGHSSQPGKEATA
jgi:bifunctional non-homologous end joining protein LigD